MSTHPDKLIIRHGKYRHVSYGHKDFLVEGLTPEGVAQARQAGERFAQILTLPETRIFTSRNLRAIETAVVVAESRPGQPTLAATRQILVERYRQAREHEGLKASQMLAPATLVEAIEGHLGAIQLVPELDNHVPPRIREIAGPVVIVAHHPTGLDVGVRLEAYGAGLNFDPAAKPISG